MNRHCIPGLTMSTALTGNFSAGVSGNIKTMEYQGLARTRITMPTPRRDTEIKPTLWFSVEDLRSVLNAQ